MLRILSKVLSLVEFPRQPVAILANGALNKTLDLAVQIQALLINSSGVSRAIAAPASPVSDEIQALIAEAAAQLSKSHHFLRIWNASLCGFVLLVLFSVAGTFGFVLLLVRRGFTSNPPTDSKSTHPLTRLTCPRLVSPSNYPQKHAGIARRPL